jgi:hypothetical protein
MLLAAAAVALTASTTSAQTQFLDGNASGFGVNVGLINGEASTGFGGEVSLSSNGLFDLGVGLNRYSIDDEEMGLTELSALGVAPRVNVHLMRQSKAVPFSVMATGSYEWVSYSGDLLDDLDVDMTGASYDFGGALYTRFALNPVLDLVPSVAVRHVENKIETEDALGAAVSRDDTGTTFSVTPSLGFKLGPVNILNLNPTLEFGDNRETKFELSLGLAIPTGM